MAVKKVYAHRFRVGDFVQGANAWYRVTNTRRMHPSGLVGVLHVRRVSRIHPDQCVGFVFQLGAGQIFASVRRRP